MENNKVERLCAHHERIVECILLYTLDETIFPGSSPSTKSPQNTKPPPLTQLQDGPKGSTHQVVSEWRGEPFRAKFEAAVPRIHTCPPTGMGTPFSDLQQLSVFAFPKGVEVRTTCGPQKGLIPPLPTHRGNVFQHSFVWTNYWDEPEEVTGDEGNDTMLRELDIDMEGCPGEDRERHYFHCATIWRPIREVYVNPVRLEIGAASIMNASDSDDEHCVPTDFYEPQVIVIVTKLPYHESFGAILRAFLQSNVNNMVNEGIQESHLSELYHSVCTPLNLELPPSWQRKRLEDSIVTNEPESPPQDQSPNSAVSPQLLSGGTHNTYFFEEVLGKGGSKMSTAAAGRRRGRRVLQPPPGSIRHVKVGTRDIMIPSRGAAEWEDEYRARCCEADMAPLVTLLQPSNVVRLFSAALLERSILILASDSSPLFDVLEALRAILFPLTWYHIYLPSLPETQFMTGQLQAPVTYLAGSAKSPEVLDNIKLENCVVADLDDDVVLDAIDYLRHRATRKEKYDEIVAANNGGGRRLSSKNSSNMDVSRKSWHVSDGSFFFDEDTDWRLEAWIPFDQTNPRHTLAAPLPPRYALKLHREIRRYAPLYEKEIARLNALSSSSSPSVSSPPTSRTISIASFTSSPQNSSNQTSPMMFEPIELPEDASDSLKLLAAREAAGAPVVDESTLAGTPAGRRARAGAKASSVVTLNVLNVIEGSSSDENNDGPHNEPSKDDDDDEEEDDDDMSNWLMLSGGSGGVVSDLDSSAPQWGSGVTSTTLQTTDWQRMRFYSLRRAFFAVLTSLLKGYREHIRTGDHISNKRPSNKEEAVAPPLADSNAATETDSTTQDGNGDASLPLGEIFDAAGFVAMRERGCEELHLKQFLSIFLEQPIFENYMHRRAAAASMDALDRAIYESRTRRALNANHSRLVRVQVLGEAFKARMDTHSNSLWGPTSWKRRLFELHHLESDQTSSSSSSGGGGGGSDSSNSSENGDSAELLSLTYYEVDSGLNALVTKEEELKLKEKSSRDYSAIRKEREGLREEINARRKRNKKGEMILRKGATAFQIPDKGHGVKFNGSKSSSLLSSGRGTHRTAFAFEIHVHDASTVKVLTICCDTHKDRRMFIRTIQNALVTRDEMNRMRDQFLTPDVVRDFHSRIGQQRRENLTHKITDSFPAPFQSRGSMSLAHMSSASVSLHQSTANLTITDPHHATGSEAVGDDMGDSATIAVEQFESDRSKCIIS